MAQVHKWYEIHPFLVYEASSTAEVCVKTFFFQPRYDEAFVNSYWSSLAMKYFTGGGKQKCTGSEQTPYQWRISMQVDHFLFFLLSLIWGSAQKFVVLLWFRWTFTFLTWMIVTKVSCISTRFLACFCLFTDKKYFELKARHQWWRVFRPDFALKRSGQKL